MKVDARFENPLLGGIDRDSEDLFSRVTRALGEACILSNRAFLKRFPKTPSLYASKVRYKNEPIGQPDQLVDIPLILLRGWGDCYHLSCWRVAELRELGDAKAALIVTRPKDKPPNVRLFHVLVRRGDGSTEDPSRLLGM